MNDTGRIAQFRVYLTEVRAEVGKVVWPTRKDTMNTTIVVFGMVVLVSLFLWMVDAVLALIVRQIIG
ncbi:MAG: preprotein translocase subunit SecE [Magnetococcales bacterium]|nr:preprotein translocase subunit SecE [Magnetococcales bacterium]